MKTSHFCDEAEIFCSHRLIQKYLLWMAFCITHENSVHSEKRSVVTDIVVSIASDPMADCLLDTNHSHTIRFIFCYDFIIFTCLPKNFGFSVDEGTEKTPRNAKSNKRKIFSLLPLRNDKCHMKCNTSYGTNIRATEWTDQRRWRNISKRKLAKLRIV